MLNHTKGENHISDKNKMTDNDKYKIHKIHKSSDVEANAQKFNFPMHKFYYVNGEHNFIELDLFGYGFNRIHPINDDAPIIVASVARDSENNLVSTMGKTDNKPDYRDSTKTLIYENKSEFAMIAMYLDLVNNYHEIEVSARKNPEENLKIIEKTKSMLEKELKCKLNERTLEEMIEATSKAKTHHK
jgi:hypothetical protein